MEGGGNGKDVEGPDEEDNSHHHHRGFPNLNNILRRSKAPSPALEH
jgi:hypothetical protein